MARQEIFYYNKIVQNKKHISKINPETPTEIENVSVDRGILEPINAFTSDITLKKVSGGYTHIFTDKNVYLDVNKNSVVLPIEEKLMPIEKGNNDYYELDYPNSINCYLVFGSYILTENEITHSDIWGDWFVYTTADKNKYIITKDFYKLAWSNESLINFSCFAPSDGLFSKNNEDIIYKKPLSLLEDGAFFRDGVETEDSYGVISIDPSYDSDLLITYDKSPSGLPTVITGDEEMTIVSGNDEETQRRLKKNNRNFFYQFLLTYPGLLLEFNASLLIYTVARENLNPSDPVTQLVYKSFFLYCSYNLLLNKGNHKNLLFSFSNTIYYLNFKDKEDIDINIPIFEESTEEQGNSIEVLPEIHRYLTYYITQTNFKKWQDNLIKLSLKENVFPNSAIFYFSVTNKLNKESVLYPIGGDCRDNQKNFFEVVRSSNFLRGESSTVSSFISYFYPNIGITKRIKYSISLNFDVDKGRNFYLNDKTFVDMPEVIKQHIKDKFNLFSFLGDKVFWGERSDNYNNSYLSYIDIVIEEDKFLGFQFTKLTSKETLYKDVEKETPEKFIQDYINEGNVTLYVDRIKVWDKGENLLDIEFNEEPSSGRQKQTSFLSYQTHFPNFIDDPNWSDQMDSNLNLIENYNRFNTLFKSSYDDIEEMQQKSGKKIEGFLLDINKHFKRDFSILFPNRQYMSEHLIIPSDSPSHIIENKKINIYASIPSIYGENPVKIMEITPNAEDIKTLPNDDESIDSDSPKHGAIKFSLDSSNTEVRGSLIEPKYIVEKFDFFISTGNYIVGVKDKIIYFSNAVDIFQFSPLNSITLEDTITNIKEFSYGILVTTANKTFLILGNNASNFRLSERSVSIGGEKGTMCANSDTIFWVYKGYLYFWVDGQIRDDLVYIIKEDFLAPVKRTFSLDNKCFFISDTKMFILNFTNLEKTLISYTLKEEDEDAFTYKDCFKDEEKLYVVLVKEEGGVEVERRVKQIYPFSVGGEEVKEMTYTTGNLNFNYVQSTNIAKMGVYASGAAINFKVHADKDIKEIKEPIVEDSTKGRAFLIENPFRSSSHLKLQIKSKSPIKTIFYDTGV